MGPYCKFCNQRCFTHMPAWAPPEAIEAYGASSIIATCPGGQQFEKEKVGWCYDDLMKLEPKCPRCGGEMHRSRGCGVLVCEECEYHKGLVRCYCGWADDGGDGRRQLEELGETIDEE